MTRLRTPQLQPPVHGNERLARVFVGLNRAMRRELAGADADARITSALSQVDRPVPRRKVHGKAAHRAQRVAEKLRRRRLFRRVDDENLKVQALRRKMRAAAELEAAIANKRAAAELLRDAETIAGVAAGGKLAMFATTNPEGGSDWT